MIMDRREAIRRASLIMGGTLSVPAILGVLQGCTARPQLDWQPDYFTEEQARLVSRVCDIIIPRTDTPGAVDAGVPPFVERMLRDVYTSDAQKQFEDGLQSFDQACSKSMGSAFNELDDTEQEAFVLAAHKDAVRDPSKRHSFLPMIKELTMLGFFTSEPGATKVLQYKAVPGAYHGCLPLSEVGKTWAT